MTPTWHHINDPINRMAGDWLSEKLWGQAGRLEKYVCMTVLHNCRLVAVVALSDWHPDEGVCELSAASVDSRWLTRNVINEMYRFPFDALKARVVVHRVSEHNSTMRGIHRRFGHKEYVIPQLRADDEAECIYTLHRDDWAVHRMNRNRVATPQQS